MPSSSLIFVLVVALWAAYLLQHWIKRREALATARSVDRFSEGMRVLQRRALVTQHAMAMNDSADSPQVSAARLEQRTSLRAGQVMTGARTMDEDFQQADDVAAPTDSPLRRAGSAAARVGRGATHKLGQVTGRQIRGGAFLASVLLLVVTVVLAPFGWAPWWSPILALALTVGVVAWLRKAALAQQASHRIPGSAPGHETGAVDRARNATPRPQTHAADHSAQTGWASPVPVVAARESFFDNQAGVESVPAKRPERATARTSQSQPEADGTWQPVAVPPPTYTMKATAPRPQAEVPVEQLPFDGLALDEELEELPSVFRAG